MAVTELSPLPEELEGLPKTEDVSLGEYPLDTLLIRSENRTVFDILRKIDSTYILDPDFQRDFVWDKRRQSRLIESVLMRIPLPVFYLAEDKAGKQIVVDGLQRLTTFQQFHKNLLRLDLPNQKDINGMTFNELPPKLQNRVEDCNLTLYVIDSKVPERARLDIFERVNSGMALTRQQMRNALYTGKATRFLKEESLTDLFKLATGGSVATLSMRDRELVNRFCAFYLLDLDEYEKDDLDDFLAKALIKMNDSTTDELEGLSNTFRRTLENNSFVFGRHAFRKHGPDSVDRRPLNVSLWDATTVALADYETEAVKSSASEIREQFYELMLDPEFDRSISYGTTDARRVRYRLEAADSAFREVLG